MYPSQTAPERYADGFVHAVSFAAICVCGGALLFLAGQQGNPALLTACAVYVAALLASIVVSSAYHLLPHHHLRKTLQRWDHAAIYAVIAGTFGPLLIVAGTTSAYIILAVAWVFALAGIWFKVFAKNIETRWSLASYLGLGWFGLFAIPDFRAALPMSALAALLAGGLFYTIGTLFYRHKTMRFRYPVWHAFGLCGAASFFAAIWISLPN